MRGHIYTDSKAQRRRRKKRKRRKKAFSGANAVNEEDPARPRYPGVEDLFRRATFLRETHRVLPNRVAFFFEQRIEV